jgi:hypothetical protein
VRKVAVFLLLSCLTACQRGIQSNEAVRQGVIAYLSGPVGLRMDAMDIKVESVKFTGDKATAAVSISLKGSSAPMMSKQYELVAKDGKWVVTGSTGDSGVHGGAMGGRTVPGAPNPHAGIDVPAPGAGGKMPSPEDLPPAGKKK